MSNEGTFDDRTSQSVTLSMSAETSPLDPRNVKKVAWTDELKFTLVNADGKV